MSVIKLAKMLDSDKFYRDLENIVADNNLSYIDAVVYYCEKNDIEIEVAASLVKSNFRIKSVVQSEGEDLNILPRTAKLPV